MSRKIGIDRILGTAGLVSVMLFTQGCCVGRGRICRTCNCQARQCSSQSLVPTPCDSSGRDGQISGYQDQDKTISDKYFADAQPVVDSLAQADRQPLTSKLSEAPIAALDSSGSARSAAAADQNSVAPETIAAEPLASKDTDSGDGKATSAQDDNYVGGEREVGNLNDAWKVPQVATAPPATPATQPEVPMLQSTEAIADGLANNEEQLNPTLAPAVVPTDRLPANLPTNDNLGNIGPIVLRAKVVQPLIRPLPVDTRQAEGRRLTPAKPVGYRHPDSQENSSPSAEVLPGNSGPSSTPLMSPMKVETLQPWEETATERLNTAGKTTPSSGAETMGTAPGVVLRAKPRASEITPAPVPSMNVQGQMAQPQSEGKNR